MKKLKRDRISSVFPDVRLRRLRTTSAVRDLLQETRLAPADLVAPIFIQEGAKRPQVIASMPDVRRIPLSSLTKEIEEIVALGIKGIILFGLPSVKNEQATSAFDRDGIVQRSVETIRKHFGENVAIITDVCLCQYTEHGHCGLVFDRKVDNDRSVETLAKVAVSHAQAGADVVAPSAMMDGQVQAIRRSLDAARFTDVAIMGYSAKQASPLYAPFRDAAHSTPNFGDRKSYQMPYANAREAMREVGFDIEEGADIVMIKPAIPYLDLIYRTRKSTDLPICAYSVSGEYALIKAAALNGWADEDAVTTEFLTSIKRAGADFIITYQAKKMAQLLAKH
jgi:porphobilinogen synthase